VTFKRELKSIPLKNWTRTMYVSAFSAHIVTYKITL
jgi:hypothetical protein